MERAPRLTAADREVKVTVTVTTWGDVADAIYRVWYAAPEGFMGGPVTPEGVAVLLSQWKLETGKGLSTPNFNLAGIKCVHPEHYYHQYFATKEGKQKGTITILETVNGKQPTNCFRAWFSLEEGVRGWLTTLDRSFKTTLHLLRQGKGNDWGEAIGPNARPGYSWYTGATHNDARGGYADIVGDLTGRYLRLVKARGFPLLPTPG
ncbi:MAG: glucosaminidase domain-containing protein [Gemmataceae bacterium]